MPTDYMKITGYKCKLCNKWHKEGEPLFLEHYKANFPAPELYTTGKMPEANERLLDFHDADKALAKAKLKTNFNVRYAFVMGAEAQDAQTLKEVGKCLEYALGNEFIVITQTNEYTISPSAIREIIEALKRGEMLE